MKNCWPSNHLRSISIRDVGEIGVRRHNGSSRMLILCTAQADDEQKQSRGTHRKAFGLDFSIIQAEFSEVGG